MSHWAFLFYLTVTFGYLFINTPAHSQATAVREGVILSEKIAQIAEKAAWFKYPIKSLRLIDLELKTISKAETISLLIEKGISEGRITVHEELRLRTMCSKSEDGHYLLLKYLQSDSKDFKKFSQTCRLVTGGNSAALGKVIGKPAGSEWAAHHIIPSELKEHWALEKIGFDLDTASNGISLPTKPNVSPTLPLHSGSHPGYTAAMKKALDDIPRSLSEEETRKAVESIQGKFRSRIELNTEGSQLHEKFGGKWQWPFQD